eukprot:GHRR01028920.1.p2 GENE.GHRR01028920.1~~GHRR01028920.1.p2  ORF type:complete len:106 (-),score=22.22 GHRR01028920.1:411-728(-)
MQGIDRMRASCQLAAEVLKYAGSLVHPGITTQDIDQAVHEMIIQNGAYPSPLNYGKFPKSVCTSVNEVMCHGIPDSRCVNQDSRHWLMRLRAMVAATAETRSLGN